MHNKRLSNKSLNFHFLTDPNYFTIFIQVPAGHVAQPPAAPAAWCSRSQRRGTVWQSDGGTKV